MASGFQFREVDDFPVLHEMGQEFRTSGQLAFDLSGVDKDDSVHSVLRFLGESSHSDFLRYHVEHETIKPYSVRFDQIRRESVIVIEQFEIYLPRNFSYIWAKTNSHNINELLKRMKISGKGNGRDFDFRERKVDLVKLGKSIQADITGGHFSELKIADVRAASIFGPGVGDSEDWHRYEDSGEISAIVFQMLCRGVAQKVLVTRNGGIVVYSNLEEMELLELVEKVNDRIGPAIV